MNMDQARRMVVNDRREGYPEMSDEEVVQEAIDNVSIAQLYQDPDDVDKERALLIHLPQGQGKCTVKWVNGGLYDAYMMVLVDARKNRK